jgi:hypothetical protein
MLCHQFKPTESREDPNWRLLMLKATTLHSERKARDPVSICQQWSTMYFRALKHTPFPPFTLNRLDVVIDLVCWR